MDKLIVKNFGPIKDISIDVNHINIFIGPTSSGKSVVAKLIAILTSPFFIQYPHFKVFKQSLVDYNLDFSLTMDTELRYSSGNSYWHIKNQEVDFNNFFQKDTNSIITFDKLNNLSYNLLNDGWIIVLINQLFTEKKVDASLYTKDDIIEKLGQLVLEKYAESKEYLTILHPIYFPAERIFISSIAETLFELINNEILLQKSIKEFGAEFEIARKNMKSLDISFLQAKYEYSDKNNYVTLQNGEKIKLETASSGFQSCIPLMIVLEYYSKIKRIIDYCYIVEEPELNLYPRMQKSLIEYIISKVNHSNDKLIITTHSPYTLTTIDNLIQAKNAFENHRELKEEITNTVPEKLWIDFNKVSCYYFEDGYCRSTLDNEYQSIGPSNIDDVSVQLGITFDRLMDLKYQD